MAGKQRVSYFYNPQTTLSWDNMKEHPIKPYRLKKLHQLITDYNMLSKLDVFTSCLATLKQMSAFHSPSYLLYLQNWESYWPDGINCYGLDDSCPPFPDLFRFCQLTTGASLAAAHRLNTKDADIAINWSGGFHHAKECKASRLCYVNDIVLAIMELLKYHRRVLYVDIGVHHGDGVQEAFYTTDRVMTVSFHKYKMNSFSGTRWFDEIGSGKGKNYTVNVPLMDGIDDEMYSMIYEPIIDKVMESYRPEVVVLQSGADSLAYDPLGGFNLTIRGHGNCLEYLKKFQIPILMLGGGGAEVTNVARCWAYETALAVGQDLPDKIPHDEWLLDFVPNAPLHIQPERKFNYNTRSYIERVKSTIFQHLQNVHVSNVPVIPLPSNYVEKAELFYYKEDTDNEVDTGDDSEEEPYVEYDSCIKSIGDENESEQSSFKMYKDKHSLVEQHMQRKSDSNNVVLNDDRTIIDDITVACDVSNALVEQSMRLNRLLYKVLHNQHLSQQKLQQADYRKPVRQLNEDKKKCKDDSLAVTAKTNNSSIQIVNERQAHKYCQLKHNSGGSNNSKQHIQKRRVFTSSSDNEHWDSSGCNSSYKRKRNIDGNEALLSDDDTNVFKTEADSTYTENTTSDDNAPKRKKNVDEIRSEKLRSTAKTLNKKLSENPTTTTGCLALLKCNLDIMNKFINYAMDSNQNVQDMEVDANISINEDESCDVTDGKVSYNIHNIDDISNISESSNRSCSRLSSCSSSEGYADTSDSDASLLYDEEDDDNYTAFDSATDSDDNSVSSENEVNPHVEISRYNKVNHVGSDDEIVEKFPNLSLAL